LYNHATLYAKKGKVDKKNNITKCLVTFYTKKELLHKLKLVKLQVRKRKARINMKVIQKGHVFYIFLSAILACFFLYYMEQVLQVTYVIKTITKISVFLFIPSAYFLLFSRKKENSALISSWTMSFLLAIGTFCGVWIGYFLFGQFVDFKAIQYELQTKSGITQQTFLWISFYVVLGNSFLEEYFFRGFIFKQLAKNNQK